MFSLYLSQKKEMEEAKLKQSQALDRAVRSDRHKRLTDALTSNYHARVEEWMERTMVADVPVLPPKPLSKGDIDVAPYRFYRTQPVSDRDQVAALPDHVQMSPRKFQTERERLDEYLSSEAHQLATGNAPYSDPLPYEFRQRHKSKELTARPFVFKAGTERERISDAISDRDIGGRAFPYEEQKLYPEFRTEDKHKWRAGQFTARLPALPVFSREERMDEPYAPPSQLHNAFRENDHKIPPVSSARFSAQVPSDRFVTLDDPSSPRCPHPPVSSFQGTHTLGAGLTSAGIYAPMPSFHLDLSKAHGGRGRRKPQAQPNYAPEETVVPKTYWKTLQTLAHKPSPHSGAYSARGTTRTEDTAQQLFHTYRKHLAY